MKPFLDSNLQKETPHVRRALMSAEAQGSQTRDVLRDALGAEDAQHLSDELLINERRLYEAALSNTPDFVYIIDLSHRFIYANRALLTMWGRNWEETFGKSFLELGYEAWHAEMHDREIEEVIKTKASIRGEVPFVGTHGKRIYDYIFSPVFGASGDVIAIAGTTRDITDRKEAEDARKKSEERWRLALEASEFVGTWDWDIEKNLVVADERFARLYSVDPAQAAQGAPIEEFLKTIHPQDVEYLGPEISKIAQEGGEFHEEYRLLRPSGGLRWVMAKGRADLEGNDKPRRFAGVVVDITERKLAEEKLKHSQAELQLLTDALPQQIWTARPDGQLDYVNAFTYNYIGEIAIRDGVVDWINVVHPDDVAKSLDLWATCIATGQPYETHQRIRHKASGQYRWNLTALSRCAIQRG